MARPPPDRETQQLCLLAAAFAAAPRPLTRRQQKARQRALAAEHRRWQLEWQERQLLELEWQARLPELRRLDQERQERLWHQHLLEHLTADGQTLLV